jgi:DNA-binding transcriptional ArsR family regulator
MTLSLQGYQSLTDTPVAFFDKLGAHVLRSLTEATSPPIEALERELTGVIRKVLAGASSELVDVLQGTSANALASDAYKLGKLSFAQQLVASAAVSRASDAFLDYLQEERLKLYFLHLLQGARTNKALAEFTGEAEETVSRKMKALRAAGVTGFRREGTYVYNFLTPSARRLLESQQKQAEDALQEEHRAVVDPVAKMLKKIRQEQPAYLQSTPTFRTNHVQ